MPFLVLYLTVMTVPGFLLTSILGVKTCRTALAISLSLSVLTLSVAAARLSSLGTVGLGYGVTVIYLVIAVVAVWRWRYRKFGMPVIWSSGGVVVIPIMTLALIAGYVLWAGPYTEVPGDPWWHIGRINDRLALFEAGEIGGALSTGDLFAKSAGYWYTILAYIAGSARANPIEMLAPLAAANTFLFSAGVYSFSNYIFRPITRSQIERHLVASISVFFFIASFGLSVFSYVRYYSFAPTILNYLVYLSAIACFLEFIRRRASRIDYLALLALFTIVATMVHRQESMFIVVMAVAVTIVQYLRIAVREGRAWILQKRHRQDTYKKRVAWLLGGFFVVYLLLHVPMYLLVERHNPLAHGVMADIRHYVPFFQNLYILKPGYQFYQVVTSWGILVYLLFAFNFKRFVDVPFLIAGMIVPVLTVFNPVFTDLFLRLSWPEVLWRLCYLIPLPFVGAYFLVTGVTNLAKRRSWGVKTGWMVSTSLLLVLLIPISTTYVTAPYSKLYTVRAVSASNDYRHWLDMINVLREMSPKVVLTDPISGYVINALTDHKYPGYKFYGRNLLGMDSEKYHERDFRRKDGWLMVINRRDGSFSETGRYGAHWPENVMEVSNLYSRALLGYVRRRPDQFEKIWEKNRVTVYLIRSS